jgi:arginyl-tRNA--protein-N-Asp/Glu arginylyltransferase
MLHGHLADCGPCPYLPGREFRAFLPEPADATRIGYRQLMDLGFRRSGAQVYRPLCVGCQECRPIRVPVASFEPRIDQRRTLRRNADLVCTWETRGLDEERQDLYHRYQTAVHDQDEGPNPVSFLVEDGGITGGELHARDAEGRLLAVSICDVVGNAWSSVYCYYAPEERRRGLGIFMALQEIALAQRLGLMYWYSGFLVRGCKKMNYKARFGPAQWLFEGTWVPVPSE